MPDGLILQFGRKQTVEQGGYEYYLPVDLRDIVTKLMGITEELCISHTYIDSEERVEIRMKHYADLERRVRDALGLDYTAYMEIQPRLLCWQTGCFQCVASSRYPRLDGITLFDRHGEEIHEIYEACVQHCAPLTLQIAKTLEVENLTPDEPDYWTKVLTWKNRRHYYSQVIKCDRDGDHESGYYDYCYGSPFLGPFTTRTLALEQAKVYDLEKG